MTDAVSIGNFPSELNKVEDTAEEIFWSKYLSVCAAVRWLQCIHRGSEIAIHKREARVVQSGLAQGWLQGKTTAHLCFFA